jgi:hypothetical protein
MRKVRRRTRGAGADSGAGTEAEGDQQLETLGAAEEALGRKRGWERGRLKE